MSAAPAVLALLLTVAPTAWADSLLIPPAAGKASPVPTQSLPHPSEQAKVRASLSDSARVHYDDAMDLWEAGDYSGALLKFELAYSESAEPRLLWDLAVCEKALRHYARALPLVRRYLAEAKAHVSETEREEAEGLADAIANFVGPVRIASSQRGATVTIDDTPVGKTPLTDPVLVDMGSHQVTLTKRGYKDASTKIRVLGPQDEQRVFLRLDRDLPAATLEVVAGSGQWISVDDGVVGRDRWEGMVSQGKHVIKVTGAGYKTKEVQADLSNGGRVSIWVVAQPLEERTNRWPLAAVLGSAAIIAAVVAYYSLRSDVATAPPRVEGKLDNIPAGFVIKSTP